MHSDLDYLFIHKNFNTIQRFQAVEFNRDWNLVNPTGDQQQIGIGVMLKNKEEDYTSYSFQHLTFSDNYTGSKHILNSQMKLNRTHVYLKSSLLHNSSEIQENTFLRVKRSS